MCLSPSLFPLPPLSPTVLEPYLKAKRKTGFNTRLPAPSEGRAPRSPAPARRRSPQKGPARGSHVCRCRAEPGLCRPTPGADTRLSVTPPALSRAPAPGGRSSSTPPHAFAAGRPCGAAVGAGGGSRSAFAAPEQRQYDFPRGLCGNYSVLTPTPRLFFFR